MPNERLRSAMIDAGLTVPALARLVDVDPKTVERWVSPGRTPHAGNCYDVARALDVSAAWLWPDRAKVAAPETGPSELVELYAHRAGAPKSLWADIANAADERIDILSYASLFLPEEHPGVINRLQEKAEQGTKIRIALADPESAELALRGEEEGLGEAIIGRVRMALAYYKPLARVDGVEFHLHRTTLYNSILRFDDQMLVNMHAYGTYGYVAPLMHLRRTPGGELFDTYASSFEKAWARSWPAEPAA